MSKNLLPAEFVSQALHLLSRQQVARISKPSLPAPTVYYTDGEPKAFNSPFVSFKSVTTFKPWNRLRWSDAAISTYFLYLNRWRDEEAFELIRTYNNEQFWAEVITLMSLDEFEVRTPKILEIYHTSLSHKEADERLDRMYVETAQTLPSIDFYAALVRAGKGGPNEYHYD